MDKLTNVRYFCKLKVKLDSSRDEPNLLHERKSGGKGEYRRSGGFFSQEVRFVERIVDVAQYIYDEYKRQSGEVIDEMKLHKLLYFTQRESLAIVNEPMFAEEFEGWKYGPVSEKVRRCYTPDGMYIEDAREISVENAYIAKNIILQYGALESWKLSQISHKELSWLNSRKGLPEGANGNVPLALEDIRKDAEKVRPYDAIWDMYYDEFDELEVS